MATGFQNALCDHPEFPAELTAEMDAWVNENCADERKEGQTDSQFVYSSRKKAIGPFKRQLWELSTKDEILASQGNKIAYLFDKLKVDGTRHLLRFIETPEWHREAPAALTAEMAKA